MKCYQFVVYMDKEHYYIAIDLKSFYASVECVERGLDPLDTCLVVADATRTAKTICLAVSPPLKKFGLGGRPRLFEVEGRMNEVNRRRGNYGKSYSEKVYSENDSIAVDYIIAPPRMGKYISYSAKIFNIYLKYFAPEDIHIYSIDEVFIDIAPYLSTYRMTPGKLAAKIVRDIFSFSGITATVGIGSNLYLSKVAMDVVAKKMPAAENGVRIAELDEYSYRRILWDHKPLTDFWRIGRGVARQLEKLNILTMGDLARYSLRNEGNLYRIFGVNAELLIDHAWGWEPVTLAEIKSYTPEAHSLSNGQVLTEPYPYWKARTVALEMADSLSMKLCEKGLVTDLLFLYLGYDAENLSDASALEQYQGKISIDFYGRPVPKHAKGSANLRIQTSSSHVIISAITEIFNHIVNRSLLIRRINVTAARIVPKDNHQLSDIDLEPDLFSDIDALSRIRQKQKELQQKEHRQQKAILYIKKKFGKNAILKGLNYEDGATQRIRNIQIGGHHE